MTTLRVPGRQKPVQVKLASTPPNADISGPDGAATIAQSTQPPAPPLPTPKPSDAPKLTYWTKKNIGNDQEATIKNFLIDAVSSCAAPPDSLQGQTVKQATGNAMTYLNMDQEEIAACCHKYGVNQSALKANSRLRLREDGELEIYDVGQPHEQPLGPVRIRAPRPDDADYPANAALKEIITSDIWRTLTPSEKEAAVSAINEALASRRRHIDLLARVETAGLPGNAKVEKCFCQRPG